MALVKRTYVDGETIITAQNLNDIQDEIISHANTFVPKTRTINSKALDANITLTASDLGAVPTTRTVNSKALSSNITLTAADVSAVPTTRTVNSKALSSNITLSASDVGAVPTTRTVNSKALSSDITLTSGDIGYNSSTTYSSGTVGKAVTDLNGAINAITPLDTVPTKDSTKGITSGAVYNGINAFDPTRTYGTISDKYTLRCFGWVSNSGKDLILTCPIGLYVASNTSLSLSNTTVNINSVNGVVSLDETQSANYLSSATLFSLGRGIYFAFRNTSGFGITNRTPLTAEINTIFAKA